MADSDARLASLEPWTSTLYLVAAALLIVHAVHHGLEAVADFTYPLEHDVPFGVAGFVLGFVALLGLYPKFADQSPKLSRAGAVFAVFGVVGWSVLGVMGVAEFAGADLPEWLGAAAILNIIGIVLGYLCFGVASLRSEVLSRTTAFMLLTPILAFVLNLIIAIPLGGEGTGVGGFVVASGFALAHVAIGVSLRTEDVPTGRAEPRPTEV